MEDTQDPVAVVAPVDIGEAPVAPVVSADIGEVPVVPAVSADTVEGREVPAGLADPGAEWVALPWVVCPPWGTDPLRHPRLLTIATEATATAGAAAVW